MACMTSGSRRYSWRCARNDEHWATQARLRVEDDAFARREPKHSQKRRRRPTEGVEGCRSPVDFVESGVQARLSLTWIERAQLLREVGQSAHELTLSVEQLIHHNVLRAAHATCNLPCDQTLRNMQRRACLTMIARLPRRCRAVPDLEA